MNMRAQRGMATASHPCSSRGAGSRGCPKAGSVRHRRRPKRRGATAVETAVVLIVFLSIALGFLDLCLANFRRNLVSEAARQGARMASVHGRTASPEMASWGPDGDWGPAEDETRIEDINAYDDDQVPIILALTTGLIGQLTGPGYLQGLELDRTNVAIDWLDGDNQVGDRVRVEVASGYRPFFVLVPELTFRASSTMRITH